MGNERNRNKETELRHRQKAVILMGSYSDLDHCKKIAEVFKKFGVNYEMRIGSAHKTPVHNLTMLDQYISSQKNYELVVITVAGLSNALSGFTKGALFGANPPIRVIACPPPSEVDAPSSYRLPKGAVVSYIPDPTNAALSVVEEFAKNNPQLADKYLSYLKERKEEIIDADSEFSQTLDFF